MSKNTTPPPKSDPPILSDALVEQLRESCGGDIVVGVDEVGRGAWAGPVAVGAVVLPSMIGADDSSDPGKFFRLLNDSKKISPKKRALIAEQIPEYAVCCAVGFETARTVNEKGLSYALTSATVRALEGLERHIDGIILDGIVNYLSPVREFSHTPVTLGEQLDGKCSSVAAASILAKVYRDEHMVKLAGEYPHYGWDNNKGYFSPQHHAGLVEYGAAPEHRTAWAWVKKYDNIAPYNTGYC